jgi:hypothetical protein
MTTDSGDGMILSPPSLTGGPATNAANVIQNRSESHTDERIVDLWLARRLPLARTIATIGRYLPPCPKDSSALLLDL